MHLWPLRDKKFLFGVLKKYFTRSLRSLVKYCSTLEQEFRISARPCNISVASKTIACERQTYFPVVAFLPPREETTGNTSSVRRPGRLMHLWKYV